MGTRTFNLTETKLREILENPGYREVFIPKRSGGQRRLLIPGDELKAVQKHLLTYLNALSVGPFAHGFAKNHSIVSNARVHVNQAAMLHVDIRDFFPSISRDKILEMIGHRPDMSHFIEDKTEEFLRVVMWDGHTPQGCPTSPCISNLVMVGFDAGVQAYVRPAKYTRYADDITISITRGRGKESANHLWKLSFWLDKALHEIGFNMAREKTYVVRSNKRMKVTGLVVNKNVRVDRQRISRLRGLFHKARKMIEANETPPIPKLRGELAFATAAGYIPTGSLKTNIMFVEDSCNVRLKNFGWRGLETPVSGHRGQRGIFRRQHINF